LKEFTWIRRVTRDYKVIYELQYTFSNGIAIVIAQVAKVPDKVQEWQSQFTCNIDRKLLRVKELTANIMQICWHFRIPPGEIEVPFWADIISGKGGELMKEEEEKVECSCLEVVGG
jgi:hypothetical protein